MEHETNSSQVIKSIFEGTNRQRELIAPAVLFAMSYPLSPNVYKYPYEMTFLHQSNFEEITQSAVALYKDTAIERIMFQEVAEMLDQRPSDRPFILPRHLNAISTGVCEEGRAYEVIAGSPDFVGQYEGRFITMQDLIVKLTGYQDPAKFKPMGTLYEKRVSPWVLSSGYTESFVKLTGDLTKSFANALASTENPIKVKFVGHYFGEEWVDLTSIPHIIRNGQSAFNLHSDRDINSVEIDQVKFERIAGTGRPEILLNKVIFAQEIYKIYLKKFIDHVNTVQTNAIRSAEDFVSQIDPRGTDKMLAMASRVVLDTWPATLLLYWREAISKPFLKILQGENGTGNDNLRGLSRFAR